MTRGLENKRIGVLMGGLSAEREVSLKTGAAVEGALRRKDCRVASLDVGPEVAGDLRRRRIDVAFVALHGRGGEDGTIQGLLETLGIPYTGSGVLASALAMDKKFSKWVFASQKIPTAPFAVLRAGEAPGNRWPFADLEPPVIVKPTREGSTIGVAMVRKPSQLREALEGAFQYGDEVMVEKYVPGRELTVGVLGGRALPVVEVLPEGGFYDYRAKYKSGTTRYLVPAPLPPARARKIQAIAVAAHAALGCRGGTRVDFRLTPAGRPFVLEVNTIPGMTETSLLPKAAAEAGMGFDDLVEWILLDALGVQGTGEREG